MPLNDSKDIKKLRQFDIDLEFGQQWEKYIDEMFTGAKTVEVKSERDKWAETGNICIEYESWNKPSGIASTEADIWVHNLIKSDELVGSIMIPTEVLRSVIDNYPPRTVWGGDKKASKLHLISLSTLFRRLKEY